MSSHLIKDAKKVLAGKECTTPAPAFGDAVPKNGGWQIEGDNYHQVADNLAKHELNKIWVKVVAVIIAVDMLCTQLGF